MSKAIIGISDLKKTRATVAELCRKLDAGENLPEADYHLGFANPTELFSEITPKRMELLEALKRTGPVSIYRLAKEMHRNYSNVHADVAKLMEYDLVEKDEEGHVYVPWDDVEIHVSLSGSRAA